MSKHLVPTGSTSARIRVVRPIALRRRLVGLFAIALLVGLMPGIAAANHVVAISGADVTVTENAVVPITVEKTSGGDINSNNVLSLQQCQTVAGSTPTESSVCATTDGKWVTINSTTTATSLLTSFDTATLGGSKIGFRAFNLATSTQHEAWSTPQDLTIDPSGGDHPGCKGVETALAKNAGKPNAEAALNAVKAKLLCD